MTETGPAGPTQLPRSARSAARPLLSPRWAVIGIFVILAFAAIAQSEVFTMPLTMSVLLFFVFAPLRRRLERAGIRPVGTAALVTSGLLAGIVVIGLALTGPVGEMVRSAPQVVERFEEKAQILSDKLDTVRGALARLKGKKDDKPPPDVATSLPKDSVAQAAPADQGQAPAQDGSADTESSAGPDEPTSLLAELLPEDGTNMVMAVLAAAPELVGQLLFVLLLLFFLIASGDLLYLKIVQSFGTMGQKRRAYAALREIEESLGSYLSTITIINALLGAVIGIAMWAWGLPAPLLFAVTGFLLNYIPYVGVVIGTLLSTAIALVTMDGFFHPLLVGGTYILLCSIEGQFITPYFVSRRLEMNTVVVFIAVALWAWLWSIVGMIVAVPILVVMRVLCDHIPGLERLGNFLGGEKPAPLGPEGDEVRGPDGQRQTGDEGPPAATAKRLAV